MPLVRYVGKWQPSSKLPDASKRKLPFNARFSGNSTQTMRVICDKIGNWYGFTPLPETRAVELFKLTITFEWYDQQCVLDMKSLGHYSEEAETRERTRGKR